MKLKDFLKNKYNINTEDCKDKDGNSIRSSLANFQPTPVLEKDLTQLSDEEIFVVFNEVYPMSKSGRFADDVINKAKEEMSEYL